MFKGRCNYSGMPTAFYECIDCKTLYPEIPSYKRQIAKLIMSKLQKIRLQCVMDLLSRSVPGAVLTGNNCLI